MTNILVSNENPKTKNLLIKSLETAGFNVVSSENGLLKVQLVEEKLSGNQKNKQLNIDRSIFPSIPRLDEVFEFIELNYHQGIGLKEVAQTIGYSSAYLTDLVRKLSGKTVNNWIIDRRITEAKRLLLETDYSVEQIAEDVGYQNINHFYCQFRDYCQNTPNAWRKAQHCNFCYNQTPH